MKVPILAEFSRRTDMATQFSLNEEGLKFSKEGAESAKIEVDLTWGSIVQAVTKIISLVQSLFVEKKKTQ